MSKFAWEPNEKLVRADEDVEPRTTDDLLKRLHVLSEPRWVQQDAVARWLEMNEPDRWMKVSLRSHGFPHGHVKREWADRCRT